MNAKEYSLKAIAFASLQPTRREDMFHAILGVTSEVGEVIKGWQDQTEESFDHVNHKEELGDITWFLNLACHSYDVDFSDLNPNVPNLGLNPLSVLIIASADLADQIKGEMVYGKDKDTERFVGNAALVLSSVNTLSSISSVTLETIYAGNIAKLTARYGEKFNLQGALFRDQEAERKAVEGV